MDDEPIILGQQRAAADKAEAARIAAGNLHPSPLSESDRYYDWRGDGELISPTVLPVDVKISALCRAFASIGSVERTETRRSLSQEDLYTLWTFSQRCAAFALRTRDSQWIVDGLAAVAMIDIARIDWRDAIGPPGLLVAVARKIGIATDTILRSTSALAEKEISEILSSYIGARGRTVTVEQSLFSIVSTPDGPGLIARRTCPYHPTVRLDQAILEIAELLRCDKYSASAMIETDLPAWWLSKVDDVALTTALNQITVGASVHATLRPGECDDYRSQGIIVFLVETGHAEIASSLLGIANEKRLRPNNFFMIAARHGRLFCLLIARSFIAGIPSIETTESLSRFQGGLQHVLEDCEHRSSPHRAWTIARLQSALRRLMGRL